MARKCHANTRNFAGLRLDWLKLSFSMCSLGVNDEMSGAWWQKFLLELMFIFQISRAPSRNVCGNSCVTTKVEVYCSFNKIKKDIRMPHIIVRHSVSPGEWVMLSEELQIDKVHEVHLLVTLVWCSWNCICILEELILLCLQRFRNRYVSVL